MFEQLEARVIVWIVAVFYFVATLVLSVITFSIMRTRLRRVCRINEPNDVVPVTSTPNTATNGSPGRQKSPHKVNRSESTKPLVHKDRLCSDNGDSPDGNTANNSGTTSPQGNLIIQMNESPGRPHKVNRSESTKPLVKRDQLGSESSNGDHAVEWQPAENHEMVGMNGEGGGQTLDEVFEEDETVTGDDNTHKAPSEERIDKKIEERLEEGKRRRRSNPRTESTKPLTGTRISESSA